MNNHKNKKDIISIVLLAIYLTVLVWIILFKLSLHFKDLPHLRSINLIPFSQSFGLHEIVSNAIIFIPFGILISMLKKEWSFFNKVLPIFVTSLILEIMQYILYIGASDITDIITNTFGGIIGIVFVYILVKIFKEKVFKILKVISIVACIGLILLIALLMITNL